MTKVIKKSIMMVLSMILLWTVPEKAVGQTGGCPSCPPMHTYFISVKATECDACNGALNLCVIGQAPFTYQWAGPDNFESSSEDISGLCEGWYSVTITDAFGNTTVNGNYIAEDCYCDLWGWVDQTPIGCNNPGTAHVDGFGGTPPYMFQWQNANGQIVGTSQTFVTTTPGTYTVIITDSGGNHQCTSDQTVVFTNPGAALNVTASPATICVGQNTQLEAFPSGNAPFTYAWSNLVTNKKQIVAPTSTTTYTVTVTDATGCTTTKSITVVVNPLPNVTVSGPSDICVGETVALTATGGGTNATYKWSTGWIGNTLTVNPGSSTTYTVTVTNANGCTKTASKTVNVHHADLTCTVEYVCEWDSVRQDTLPLLTNQWGCDSTVIVSYQLAPSQVTVVDSFVCNISQIGRDTIPHVNPFGCDSLVIVIRQLADDQTTVLPIAFTCELSEVGVFVDTLLNTSGCDSLVIRTVSLAPSQVTVVDSFVCNISQIGRDTIPHVNPFGCDSLVIVIRQLADDQTTVLPIAFTCELSEVGVFVDTLLNTSGCDSLVVRTVMFGGVHLDGVTTDVTCNGLMDGSVHLTIFSQDSISDIFWSNGVIDEDLVSLSAGNYSVTVTTASGCESTATFVINEPLPISLETTIENPTCHGSNNGLLDVFTEGGTAPYSLIWNNSSADHLQTGLGAGAYSVTVTDANGCQTGTSFQLIQPDSIVLTATLQPTSCEGLPSGAIDLTATGGSGTFSYDWSDFFSQEDRTNLLGGTYGVTVSDANGCKVDTSFMIKENGCTVWYAYGQLHVIIGRCGELPTFDFEVTVSDISGKIVKTFNGIAVDGYFDGTFDVSSLTPGIYTVTVIGANNEVRHGSRFVKQ